jgi:protein-L-isoaspartate O-methyltransferase
VTARPALGPQRLAALRAGMARRLAAYAGLDAAWRRAFADVPREDFIPDTVWRGDQGRGVRVRRSADCAAWHALLYDEHEFIVTQLDDGQSSDERGGDGHGPGSFTSSSSAPLVMALMLARLPTAPGTRVFEVGTGTGYNSALLAHRYGARNVVSCEIDAVLADRAARSLHRAGFPVTVLCGDGLAPRTGAETAVGPGSGPGAEPGTEPFDALISTCSVTRVPRAWLRMVPDGVLVAPFSTDWLNVACLVLETDDGDAVGRFAPGFTFMRARGHRSADTQPVCTVGGRARTSALPPSQVTAANEAGAFAVSLQLPGLDYWVAPDHDGIRRMTVWDERDPASWAVIDWERPSEAWPVREEGPRDLWREVETAYARWAACAMPSPDRYDLSSRGDRLVVSLDGFGRFAEIAIEG